MTDKINLTKYTPGGIGELLAVSCPIMLSSASGILMVFIDRVILSYYSPEAFDACFSVMHWYGTCSAFILEFVLISEVFVGQYNGAQRYKEIGPIIWQMIWFCAALFILFIPLALCLPPYLVAEQFAKLGVPYLNIILLFIPINCIGTGAFAAFFVGRGETKVIPVITVSFNILNIILDFLLIFGCRLLPGGNLEIISGHSISIPMLNNPLEYQIIPEFGIRGAAIATVISQCLSTLLLFILFLRKSYRERYGTWDWKLRKGLLKQSLKMGYPNAFNRLFGMLALVGMTQVIIVKTASNDAHAYGIIHTLFLLFCFVGKGMSAGVRTICSNAFGAKEFGIISRNIRSWICLSIIFGIIIGIGALVYPDLLIGIFSEKMVEGEIYRIVRHMLIWLWIGFWLDLFAINFAHLLLALGDTAFPMHVSTLSFVFIGVLPTYMGIVKFGCCSVLFWQFSALHYFIVFLILTYRYRSGRWMKSKLI
ncbi:MAG: hypothetical protein LBS71_02880 [Puniceicoccales bacterium]|jgi:MATE family multidrug resistance protein|nr:hypothetical protein [Puniceicoccales bacterium]